MKQVLVFFIAFLFIGCKKQDKFLDVKSNLSDVIPTKLEDFQALLDNDEVMNADYPGLPVVGSDNYYVTYASWQSRATAQERNAYIWAKDIFEGERSSNWNACYKMVEYANIVLKGLEKIKPNTGNSLLWNNVKGSALFFRAYSFYNLAQSFANPYSSSSASTDLGIPLRLTEDINEVSSRSSIKQTYAQIETDLIEAESLLPETPIMKTRPSKTAANALLARVYLTMEDYPKALQYANSTLSAFNFLIDYNSINPSVSYPFPKFNTNNGEIIFYSVCNSFGILNPANLKVDTLLYQSYSSDDLRKTLFYNDKGINGIAFRGNYTGIPVPFFAGISSNEIYLIKAESNARLGNTSAAIDALNFLLNNRWKTGTYHSYIATDADDALAKILNERRKELPFTGSLRWEDLRRLNKDPRFAKDLSRNLNGQTYLLPANDNRYTYPIPDDEIRINGIPQNPR